MITAGPPSEHIRLNSSPTSAFHGLSGITTEPETDPEAELDNMDRDGDLCVDMKLCPGNHVNADHHSMDSL